MSVDATYNCLCSFCHCVTLLAHVQVVIDQDTQILLTSTAIQDGLSRIVLIFLMFLLKCRISHLFFFKLILLIYKFMLYAD